MKLRHVVTLCLIAYALTTGTIYVIGLWVAPGTAPHTPRPIVHAASAVPCGEPGGLCSTVQVAAHNRQEDCWVMYDGGYHIITANAIARPGGALVLNASACGKDITDSVTPATANVLKSYFVGPVQ